MLSIHYLSRAVLPACLAVAACRVDSRGIADAGSGGSIDQRPSGRDGGDDRSLSADGPPIDVPPDDDDDEAGGGGLAPGSPCGLAEDCASGVCADGICCDSACTGDCEACNVVGSVGSCVPLKGPPRPGRAACIGAGTPCGGACDGINRDACQYPGGDTTCKPASCAEGRAVARAVCSGSGVCLPALEVSCAPYACDGDICAGGCSAGRPCTEGSYCNAGRCTPLAATGETCTAGDQCLTGFCVDGRCCNRACAGACEACNLAGALGTCGPIDLTGDASNCGTCGTRCPGTRCLAGSCEKIELTWSFAGPAPGPFCVHFNEPSDPHTWVDNHLCTQRDFGLRWSLAGPIAGMVCTLINEPSDPDQWHDNYLCAPVDYGLRWSYVGPIPNLRCTRVNEPSEPALEAWTDNYLCAP